MYVKSNTLLTFVLLSYDRNKAVKLSVVDDNFIVCIYILGNEVPRTHAVFHKLPATVSSANSVALLLKSVLRFVICEALPSTRVIIRTPGFKR